MKRTSTLPYFQLDSGKMLSECMGLSMEERGMYLSLMLLYWENDCRLYPRDALVKKLVLRSQKSKDLLATVIAEFFPDGVHARLDDCKANAERTSRQNSANVGKRYREKPGIEEKVRTPQEASSDPYDF